MTGNELVDELRRRMKKEGMQAVLDDFEKRGVSDDDMQEAMANVKLRHTKKKTDWHIHQGLSKTVSLVTLFAFITGGLMSLLKPEGGNIITEWLYAAILVFVLVMLDSFLLMLAAKVVSSGSITYLLSIQTKLFSWIINAFILGMVFFFPQSTKLIILAFFWSISEITFMSFFLPFSLSKSFVAFFLKNLFRAFVYGIIWVMLGDIILSIIPPKLF
ncbi:MAG: hypothetical protein ABIH34_06460 [Nanoarchaeota archaeon]